MTQRVGSPVVGTCAYLDVGNAPYTVDPAVTGKPRNKVALKPGHSLMDWVRLGHSGVDLTGVGGVLQDVTPEQLAAHGKKNDAWIAIRGKMIRSRHKLAQGWCTCWPCAHFCA
jgi:hypothetical protein